MTTTALRDAVSLGFDRMGVVAVVRSVEPAMFFKSMTTYADHRLWQDVYHVPSGDLILYLKVKADVVTEFRIVSFKER